MNTQLLLIGSAIVGGVLAIQSGLDLFEVLPKGEH